MSLAGRGGRQFQAAPWHRQGLGCQWASHPPDFEHSPYLWIGIAFDQLRCPYSLPHCAVVKARPLWGWEPLDLQRWPQTTATAGTLPSREASVPCASLLSHPTSLYILNYVLLLLLTVSKCWSCTSGLRMTALSSLHGLWCQAAWVQIPPLTLTLLPWAGDLPSSHHVFPSVILKLIIVMLRHGRHQAAVRIKWVNT